MPRVVGLSSDELLTRERVLDGLTTRAIRLSLRAATLSVDALVTAAATPALSSNPSDPNPTIPAGALGVVTTTWSQAVDERLFPYVVQTFVDAAEHVYDALSETSGFDAPKITYAAASTYLANARNRLVGIGDVVWADMRAQLALGYAAGESIEQLAGRLRKVAQVSEPRALTIARTEVVPAANFGSLQQLKAAGFTDDEVRKEWLATDDKRTRESHREADGQLVGLSEPFQVDGDYLQVPGDPAGRADNVINCRCSVGYVFDDDEDDDEDEPMIADAAFEAKHPRDENGRFGTKSTFQILPKEMRGRSGNELYAPGMLGQYGGAGIMMRHVGADGVARYMVVQRGGLGKARWRWQLPGGSRDEHETATQAAAREANEEIGVTQEQLDTLEPRGAYVARLPVEDKEPWTYSVALADAPQAFKPKIDYKELGAARWLTYDQLLEMRGRGRLITPFAAQLDDLVAKFDDPLTASGFSVTHMTTSDDRAGYYDLMIAAKRWDESKVKRDSEGQFAEKASTAVKIKTPLHVNTAVIYKKGGYADGTVIAEKNDAQHGPMRLIWSQPAKKFILQAGLDDGDWMSVEVYGKGQAYDKFSKETGWFKPEKAQPKAPASLKAVAAQKVADATKAKVAELQAKAAGLGLHPALKPKTTKIDPAIQQLLDFEKTPEPPKTSGMEWLEARAAAYKKAVANREAYAQTGAKQAQIAQFVSLWTGASTQEAMKKAIAKGEYAEVVEATKNAPAPTLYRGFSLKKAKLGDKKSSLTHGKFQGDPDKFINDLKPGFEIDLGGMAAFTEDEEHAGTFGDVTFVMKDGHGLPIEGISNTPFEHEWLVTGKMRVESVAKKGKKYVVEVSHVIDAPTSPTSPTPPPKKATSAEIKVGIVKAQLADGGSVDQMSPAAFIDWFSQKLNVDVWDKLNEDEQAKVYAKAVYAAKTGNGGAPLATLDAWGYVKPKSKLDQAIMDLAGPKPSGTAAPAVGIGKPIHINTAVIYKTKFTDGAVVAEKDEGGGYRKRLIWNAGTKKFELQTQTSSTASWKTASSYNKGEAYKRFSKETGWTHPVAAAPVVAPAAPTSAPSSHKHVIDMNESELLDWIDDNAELISKKPVWPMGAVGMQLDKYPKAYNAYWDAFFGISPGNFGPKTADASDVEDFLEVTKPEKLKDWLQNVTDAELATYDDESLDKLDNAVLELLTKGYLTHPDAVVLSNKVQLSMSAYAVAPVDPALTDFLSANTPSVLAGWIKNLTPTDLDKYNDAELDELADKVSQLVSNGDLAASAGAVVAKKISQASGSSGATPSTTPATSGVDPKLLVVDFDDISGPDDTSPLTYNGTLIAWAKTSDDGSVVSLYVAETDGDSGDHLTDVDLGAGQTIGGAIALLVSLGDLDLKALNGPAPSVTPSSTIASSPTGLTFSPKASKWHIEAQTKIKPLADIGTPKTGPVSFKQTTDAGMQKLQTQMKSSWTTAQEKSIARYVKPKVYQAINGVLRDDKRRLKLFTDAQLTQAVADTKNIQDSMAPLADSLVLHRGTGAQSFGFADQHVSTADLKAKLEGKTIREKGFTSTSVINPTIVPFDYAKKPIKVIINAPEGTPSVYISSVTDEHENQNELLLGAGTSFRVDEVRAADATDKSAYGSYVEQVVVLTVVPSTTVPTPSSPAPSATSQVSGTPAVPAAALKSVTFNKPIKITTTLIYKNKYAHGAVVGYQKSSSGSVRRLVWNANTKKFIEQNQNPDGSWMNFAGYGKGEAYQKFGKTIWYAPPSGDSAIGSGGLFGTTTVAPKVSTSAPAPATSTVAAPPAPVKQEKFDADELQKLHGQVPAAVSDVKKRELFDYFKKKSTVGNMITLSSSESDTFQALYDTWKENDNLSKISSLIPSLNMLQILRIIDEESTNKANAIAKNEGKPGDLVNAQLYEKKLVAWLQTPSGATYAANLLYPPPPAPYDPSGPINANKTYKSANFTSQIIDTLHKIKDPAMIGTPDPNANVFAPISYKKALELQQAQLANAPWTTTQKNALTKYTGQYYTEMNPVIRDIVKDTKYMSETAILAAARTAVNIQDAMRPLPESVKVFRKTNPEQFSAFGLTHGAKFADIKKLEGKLFIDQAPMSTSIDPNKWSGSVHFEIDLPKGTPAIFVDNISNNKGELEMLLGLGLKYRIISVKEQYGITKVHMRVEA